MMAIPSYSSAVNLSVPAIETAGVASAVVSDDIKQLIAKNIANAGGGKIVIDDFFSGPNGLVGVLFQVSGVSIAGKPSKVVAWSTADGETLIFGDVLSNNVNMTKVAMDIYASDITVDINAQSEKEVKKLSALQSAAGVTAGVGSNDVYIVFDPKCPHCRRLYHLMQDNKQGIAESDLSIKWIPVNVMNSANWGAYIIANGLNGLDYMEGASERADPGVQSEGAANKILKNTQTLSVDLKMSAVPNIHWVRNGVLQSIEGVPTLDGLKYLFSK